MLTCLRVQNLAIIEAIEVGLGPGLNVLTGETGAGKSILIAALGLVMGGRARPELVRTGAERAEVEALFDLRGNPRGRERLAALGFGEDPEVVLRRVVEAEGRSRAYVNGRLATVAQLAALAADLVDISSQHEHHALVDPATHLGYLDAFAGIAQEPMAAAFAAWRAAEVELDQLRAHVREDRADLLRFQAQELASAVTDAERVELEGEAVRLRHAERLGGAARDVEAALYSGERSIAGQVGRLAHALEDAARLDPSLVPMVAQLQGAQAELEDVGRELGRYGRGVQSDPARLAHVEEVLAEQRRLRRKFGDDLEAARARVGAELATLDGAQDRLAVLDDARERLGARAREVAAELSEARRRASLRLGQAISAELAALGMGEARVEVDVAEGGLGAHGADRAEFLIATNRGEAPRPLRKVASGGELSRSLLAVKRVLAQLGPVGTYVFDEVDAGVGGSVAEAIGERIADVARHHQVLCITHLAQIAAFGRRHLRVEKRSDGERTRSGVVVLGEAARLEELARMMGGREVTDTTRAAARELLGAARG